MAVTGPAPPLASTSNTSPSTSSKYTGNSRDLYALIGPSAPSIVAQLHKPRQKQKSRLSGAVKWEWRPFTNAARSDSLQLGHWVKSSTNPEAVYPFAKYNMPPPMDYSYTDEEYSRALEDPEWTKDETDYLFTVVRQYDQRWYIIFDRYQYPGKLTRTVEDLKERYCNVCRRLLKDRPWTGDPAVKTQLLTSFSFDKEREMTRKRYLDNLDRRSAREVEEEEALYLEIKRIEQNERKFKRDREELLRTLAGIESGLPDIIEDELPSILFDNSKKRKKGLDLDSPSTPVPPSASISAPPALPPPKRPIVNPKVPPPDPSQCITHIELSPTTPATKAAHQPSYLRSFKLPNPKAAILPKVMQTLSDMGIAYNRLVMPTENNVVKLTALVESTIQMLEMKKVLDKTEYDIKALKERLGMRESAVVEGDDSLSLADGASDIVMLDDGADELGRSQSVVSTRSARSRKQRGRSLSVSSVDTSISRAPKRARR